MDRPSWAPAEADPQRPSPARIYDYLLGGSHNFAVDRELAERVLAAAPQVRLAAHANRAFLRRAVDHLVAAGVRQFVDLGSGIPTVGNVHETARRAAPDARVVYVDHDAVAVSHSREIVAATPGVVAIQADIREPDTVINNPLLRETIDLSRPVGLLMLAVLHFVVDDSLPPAIVAEFMAAVAPGSYLVISHVGSPSRPATPAEQAAADHYTRANPIAMRSREQVTGFFAGLDLVPPGVVDVTEWRPEPGEVLPDDLAGPRIAGHVGVAVKPANR